MYYLKQLITIYNTNRSYLQKSDIWPWNLLQGGWPLVCALCAIQGLALGLLYPSVVSILANWVPMEEKSRTVGFVYSGKFIIPFIYLIAVCLIRSGLTPFTTGSCMRLDFLLQPTYLSFLESWPRGCSDSTAWELLFRAFAYY